MQRDSEETSIRPGDGSRNGPDFGSRTLEIVNDVQDNFGLMVGAKLRLVREIRDLARAAYRQGAQDMRDKVAHEWGSQDPTTDDILSTRFPFAGEG